MDNNLPEQSLTKGTSLVESHGCHQVQEDDRAYSTIGYAQPHMRVTDGNPVDSTGFERSQESVHHYDRTCFDVRPRKEQELVVFEVQANGETQDSSHH